VSSEDSQAPSGGEDERIRKIYVKDLKTGETVHTVFRAAKKEKHTSRGGKTFLSFLLQDKTGEVDGRVFEAVDAADQAFADGDYLLVKGKVGVFHGKSQLVLDSLERLDPTPMDAQEFTPPPPKEPQTQPQRTEGGDKDARKATRQRILRLLDDPVVLDGLTAILKHLDARGDEPKVKPHRERGPRVEHKPEAKPPEQKKPPRDASLPQTFAFKPFSAVAGAESPPAAAPADESPKSDA
jgi:OB-fold nucleic acid binding domain